ncbi:hypothetical protein [Fictibacillus enclensis]|uniref:hypothetical protein n=1 Tax=Fictibacillus enclensis TaxID=1017270 RepID=UPI0024BF2D86|nr:hypothetical protein [Fictibacillus enclensis]WHY72982.1 hypothetical protein QNH15_03340 [Fictibacillus enclensis]
MLPILLIAVAVILIVVLIVINTRAFSSRNKEDSPVEEPKQSPDTDQPDGDFLREETSAAVDQHQEQEPATPSSPKGHAPVPEKDPNSMGDDEYRKALQKLKTKPSSAAPAEPKEKLSMKDNDYRNALKSMQQKRDTEKP